MMMPFNGLGAPSFVGFPVQIQSTSNTDSHGLSIEKAKFCLNFAIYILLNIENSELIAVSIESRADEFIIIINQKVMAELSRKEYETEFKDNYKKLSWKKRNTPNDSIELREKILTLMEQAAERAWQRFVQKIRTMTISMALYCLPEFQVIIHELNDPLIKLEKNRFFEVIQSLDEKFHNVSINEVLGYSSYWLTSFVLIIIATAKFMEIPMVGYKITNLHDHKKLSYGITISKVDGTQFSDDGNVNNTKSKRNDDEISIE